MNSSVLYARAFPVQGTPRRRTPNNRFNSDGRFRCAPLPTGYAGRYETAAQDR
jgi:hypothetical protein